MYSLDCEHLKTNDRKINLDAWTAAAGINILPVTKKAQGMLDDDLQKILGVTATLGIPIPIMSKALLDYIPAGRSHQKTKPWRSIYNISIPVGSKVR